MGLHDHPRGLSPGDEIDYVQITSDASTTTSVDAITGNAVTYDGATRICIQVYCSQVSNGGAGATAEVYLYEGSTDLGRLGNVYNPSARADVPLYCVRFLTPSTGSHTYKVKLVHGNTASTVSMLAGAGGAGTAMPAFLRITKA